ncbi:DUF1643 domain-containing protein [Cytobacillus gottheilii]|uniref:DUF1643 domain-containing protein n=1 Tax=Cytobacillus gottheilii TaxID=859144 RepID=UPI0008306184|nr:DUF1643 domain-containing protein [Cytobacillus gottheilii]
MSKDYPSYVKVSKIKPVKNTYYRVSLEIQNSLQSNNHKTVVIMMNPSAADANNSDETVNKVIKALRTISETIYILNLFPFYEPNSKKLGDLVKKKTNIHIVNQNKVAISQAIKNADKIIFAWGDVPKGLSAKLHNERVKSVIDIVNLYNKENCLYVFNYIQKNKLKFISKKKRPLHPSRKNIHSLKSIKSYYFRRSLLNLEFD